MVVLQEGRTVTADEMSEIRRLMLVEDDLAVAEGMRILLALEGIEVCVVSRGTDVELTLDRFMPEVVVLDLSLPDGDGVDVFRRIRRRLPHLPVIFSTGHFEHPRLAPLLSLPGVSLLTKPYGIDELLAVAGRLLSDDKPLSR